MLSGATAGVIYPVPAPGGPDRSPDFPGCDPVPMSREEVETTDGRFEYWEHRSGTAWVIREGSPDHTRPPGALGAMVERIALMRGSPILCYGAVYLMEQDGRGRAERVALADQTIYLHPGAWQPRGQAIVKGRDPWPDMILEVDHTTDVRRRKLLLYESWGLPELWVEVPEAPTPNRRGGLRPGLRIYVLEGGRYRLASCSRAFPGWSADSIHLSLNERAFSALTMEELERVGRGMGALEGTSPEDDLLLGRYHRTVRAAGLAEGLEKGRAEGMEKSLAEAVAEKRTLLRDMAAHKFGADAAGRLAEFLAGAAHRDRFAEAALWIIDCSSGEELISRIRGSGPPPKSP